jgi:hypothetical protein
LTAILNQGYIISQCSPLFKDRQTGLVGGSRLVPLFCVGRNPKIFHVQITHI